MDHALGIAIACPTVDEELFSAYLAALAAVDACQWYDDERLAACRTAGVIEVALFGSLGFEPYYEEASFSPIQDANGVPLAVGTEMTYAASGISNAQPVVPYGYHLIGEWAVPEGLPCYFWLYRLLDPEYRMWETVDTIGAVDREPVERQEPICVGCGSRAEHKETYGSITLELCRECYRPLAQAELLALGVAGRSTFFGNENLIRNLGPQVPQIRAELDALRERIRARSGHAPDLPTWPAL